jgi:hypothetical protein
MGCKKCETYERVLQDAHNTFSEVFPELSVYDSLHDKIVKAADIVSEMERDAVDLDEDC